MYFSHYSIKIHQISNQHKQQQKAANQSKTGLKCVGDNTQTGKSSKKLLTIARNQIQQQLPGFELVTLKNAKIRTQLLSDSNS
jgi:hypothetical protein